MSASDELIKMMREQLAKLDERLDKIDITMERNTASLEEHMRRTEILEEDVKPIKVHVQLMNSIAKIASIGLTVVLAAKSLELF